MTHDELKFKESVLRECFKEKLEMLNVEGDNDIRTIKCIKTFGALWHYTHQLLLAEEYAAKNTKEENIDTEKNNTETTAETMNIQATGLKMTGNKG